MSKPSERIREIIGQIDLSESNPLPIAIVKFLDEQAELHSEEEKGNTCQKPIEGGKAICGCKLDCHLHDWRANKDYVSREEVLKVIEGMKFENHYDCPDTSKCITCNRVDAVNSSLSYLKAKITSL